MQQRISLITLGVKDLKRARNFYLKKLGWRESSASQETICFMQLNGVALALYPHHALLDDIGIKTDGSITPGGVTLAYNARTREEVDEVLEKVQSAGGKLIKPAQDVFWGGYSGYFSDPDGHLWEVAWNPFFDIDEAGNLHLPE